MREKQRGRKEGRKKEAWMDPFVCRARLLGEITVASDLNHFYMAALQVDKS